MGIPGIPAIDRLAFVIDGVVEVPLFADISFLKALALIGADEYSAQIDGQDREVRILDLQHHSMVRGYVILRIQFL